MDYAGHYVREHYADRWHITDDPDGLVMRCGVTIGGAPLVSVIARRSAVCPQCRFYPCHECRDPVPVGTRPDADGRYLHVGCAAAIKARRSPPF